MSAQLVTGQLILVTGGFYYLRVGSQTIECHARGLFRKQGISPCVGDLAEAELTEQGKGYLLRILPRRNELLRPPSANVDLLLLVLAAAEPSPNLLVADRMLAVAEHKGIDAAVLVTKGDLDGQSADALTTLYTGAHYAVRRLDPYAGNAKVLCELVEGKLCVLCGNTGVGKSTLLNALSPALQLPTGEISQKLGRGRHTTRTTKLFDLCNGQIADTPGFSTLETSPLERIRKEELELCFREFAPFLGKCRFTGCSHSCEIGCAVLAALEAGEIAPARHKSYLAMLEESRTFKDWEIR